jgi:hypothetical protein
LWYAHGHCRDEHATSRVDGDSTSLLTVTLALSTSKRIQMNSTDLVSEERLLFSEPLACLSLRAQHPLVLITLVAHVFPSGPDAVLVGSPLVTPLNKSHIAFVSNKHEFLIDVVSAVVSTHLKYVSHKTLTTKIPIHASHQLARLDLDVVECALAPILCSAVPATAVQLADVFGVKVLDSKSASTIVLEDFVIRALCTAAVDVRGAGFLLERGSVFAYIHPPDVVECAGTLTVDTLAVVRSNNDVGQSRAVFEDEDCVLVSRLGLTLASVGYNIVNIPQLVGRG